MLGRFKRIFNSSSIEVSSPRGHTKQNDFFSYAYFMVINLDIVLLDATEHIKDMHGGFKMIALVKVNLFL